MLEGLLSDFTSLFIGTMIQNMQKHIFISQTSLKPSLAPENVIIVYYTTREKKFYFLSEV